MSEQDKYDLLSPLQRLEVDKRAISKSIQWHLEDFTAAVMRWRKRYPNGWKPYDQLD